MRRLSLTIAVGMVLMPLAVTAIPAHAVTGDITEFSLPTANSGPARIAAGPDGNLWFTEV
jgi:virginiamycin B lyase